MRGHRVKVIVTRNSSLMSSVACLARGMCIRDNGHYYYLILLLGKNADLVKVSGQTNAPTRLSGNIHVKLKYNSTVIRKIKQTPLKSFVSK